jgi:hypothetical protein
MPDEDHGTAQHDPIPVGTRRRTGDVMSRAGAWEIVDHGGCPGANRLEAFAAEDVATRCPVCGRDVTWQLTHLAPVAAADHRGVGPLP